MGKAKHRDLPDLAHLAQPGATIAVRATPGAARDRIVADGETLRVTVTAIAEGGRANAAVQALLARALGVAPGRLTLVRGHAARDKVFRYDVP